MAENLFEKYLKLIQESFNINDSSIGSGIDSLGFGIDYARKYLIPSPELQRQMAKNATKTELWKRQIEQANLLSKQQADLKVKNDSQLLNRFNDITDLIIGENTSIRTVLSLTDDVVDDLIATREWMLAAIKFLTNIKGFDQKANMERLIAIGKAVLGRAIELTPYKTGLLRRSGALLIYDDYIVIVFAAPYATYVHENLESRHTIGRAKFLEIALQEFFPDKKVWVEIHGESIVYAKISIDYTVLYKHYD